MSRTLEQLLKADLIQLVETDLAAGQMPERQLYVTKDFARWTSGLSDTPGTGKLIESEVAELEGVFGTFIAGKRLGGIIVGLNPPTAKGLMRLQTFRLRLFGWAVAPQQLVLARGATKDEIVRKIAPSNYQLGKQVMHDRKILGVTTWATGHWYELFSPKI